jgi:uncharacterized protein YjbI with pentapeptide repeats
MRASEIRARLTRPWVHGEAADLRGLTVDEPLDLAGLVLAGVDFTGTRFNAPLLARGARFDGLSWFDGCTFAAADFAGAVFLNDARFKNTRFATAPDFSGAEVRGILALDGAEVGDGLFDGLTCYGNASLARLSAGDARFTHCEFLGGFWAQDARLGSGARFTDSDVHGRLWLRGARAGNAPLAPEAFGLRFGYAWT